MARTLADWVIRLRRLVQKARPASNARPEEEVKRVETPSSNSETAAMTRAIEKPGGEGDGTGI
jgi:hypothetical protein